MTKADRIEFEERRAKLDYWRQLSLDNLLAYGLTSKRKFLESERAKEQQK